MIILIDTNVLLDVIIKREPYHREASLIMKACADKRIQGYMAAHSVPNMYYILRKYMSEEDRRSLLKKYIDILDIAGIGKAELSSALENGKFTDFEDCIQAECAANIHADYIITRNKKDFMCSRVPCLTPEEFLQMSGIVTV